MFAKMRDDVESNVRFIEMIKNHPVLYDDSHRDCINILNRKKTWETIAQQLGDKDVNECKKRWSKIRTSYINFKRNQYRSGSAPKRKGPMHDLAPHLQFLDNFLQLKSVPLKYFSNYHTVTDESTRDSSQSGDCEFESEEPQEFTWASPPSTSPVSSPRDIKLDSNPPSLSSSSGGTFMKTKSPNQADQNQSALEFFTTKQDKASEVVNTQPLNTPLYFIQGLLPPLGGPTNPPIQAGENQFGMVNFTTKRHKTNEVVNTEPLDADLSFLQSLLPDMKTMNLAQKRCFKIGVMELVGQILDENGEISSPKNAQDKSRLVEARLKAELARKRPVVVLQKRNHQSTWNSEDEDVET